MKRLALVALVCAAPASARVVMTPTIPRSCRMASSWPKMETCLARFGKVTTERELAGVKLVSITNDDNDRVPGLYLYRQQDKNWIIAGMYETVGAFVVTDLTQPTIAKHTGYRFDVGIVQPTSEDAVVPAGVMRTNLARVRSSSIVADPV